MTNITERLEAILPAKDMELTDYEKLIAEAVEELRGLAKELQRTRAKSCVDFVRAFDAGVQCGSYQNWYWLALAFAVGLLAGWVW